MTPGPKKQVQTKLHFAKGDDDASSGPAGSGKAGRAQSSITPKGGQKQDETAPRKPAVKLTYVPPEPESEEEEWTGEEEKAHANPPAKKGAAKEAQPADAVAKGEEATDSAEQKQATIERRSKKAEDRSNDDGAKPKRKRLRWQADDDDEEEGMSGDEEVDEKPKNKNKTAKEKGKKAKVPKEPEVDESKVGMQVDEPSATSDEGEDTSDQMEVDESGDKTQAAKEDAPAKEKAQVSLNSVLGKGGKSSKPNAKGKAKATSTSTKEIIEKVFEAIDKITARLEIIQIVYELFVKLIDCCPKDLVCLLYLICNRVAPAYEGKELGVGESILINAIADTTGRKTDAIKKAYEESGDLGKVAQSSRHSQTTLSFGRPASRLTIQVVLKTYRDMAATSGEKSQERKKNHIMGLLRACAKEGNEAKYIIRGLQGKLRIGLAEHSVMTALAHAMVVNPPKTATQDIDLEDEDIVPPIKVLTDEKANMDSRKDAAEAVVKQAYSECPSYDKLVSALLEVPLPKILHRCRLTPGIPVTPMLAKPTKSIQEVTKRLSGKLFTMEYKYDGERAQVHRMEDGSTKIFSRNSEDMTSKYPDLIEAIPQMLGDGVTSFVMDAEVVAFDREAKILLPFQILSTRKRKDEKTEDVKVNVILQGFDLIFLNNKPLLRKSLKERREALRANFREVENRFAFAVNRDHMEDGDTAPIEEFLAESVRGHSEGLMLKTLDVDATYEPSLRSLNWLKLKKDYLTGEGGHGVADSLDLVVIGGYKGKGKRAGWYGAYLLACYDPELEEYQSVCKVGTGLSEDRLERMTEEFASDIIPKKPQYYKVHENLDCDVWFEARKVWEVRAADLSISPVHKGAFNQVEAGKGIGLRFPRLVRERDDKSPENATSAKQVAELYKGQDMVAASSGNGKAEVEEDDDEYI